MGQEMYRLKSVFTKPKHKPLMLPKGAHSVWNCGAGVEVRKNTRKQKVPHYHTQLPGTVTGPGPLKRLPSLALGSALIHGQITRAQSRAKTDSLIDS